MLQTYATAKCASTFTRNIYSRNVTLFKYTYSPSVPTSTRKGQKWAKYRLNYTRFKVLKQCQSTNGALPWSGAVRTTCYVTYAEIAGIAVADECVNLKRPSSNTYVELSVKVPSHPGHIVAWMTSFNPLGPRCGLCRPPRHKPSRLHLHLGPRGQVVWKRSKGWPLGETVRPVSH